VSSFYFHKTSSFKVKNYEFFSLLVRQVTAGQDIGYGCHTVEPSFLYYVYLNIWKCIFQKAEENLWGFLLGL
jgi:hypothetical protein